MPRFRQWREYGRVAGVVVVTGLLGLILVTGSQAAPEGKPDKGVEIPVPGQQLSPAPPGVGACQIKVECPPLKAPGKAACQTTIDCPGVKKPDSPKKTLIIE
jgi:hypothetical protein